MCQPVGLEDILLALLALSYIGAPQNNADG